MPASTLRVRSGLSCGFSVNASSKPVGGRIPVPNDACTLVLFTGTYAAESLGLARETVLAGKNGREYPSVGIAGVRIHSARTPAFRKSLPPNSKRFSRYAA